jgi:SpoVK/Ycf46/Vps4 family AAA+-type ATPase
MNHFHIVQALCRAALANPTDAVRKQIERLSNALKEDGDDKGAKSLNALLASSHKSVDMAPSRIQTSRTFVIGEELTKNTPIPVDKETSSPLAEIRFPDELPSEPPIFNESITQGIESVLNEWRHFDKLNEIKADPIRSCLIYGAPGTGKTQLALWMARQLNLPVVLVRLDGMISSFLGTTSRNIGNLFAFAARYRCVLLLDEFDAIAKLRNDSQEIGEIKRVVNTLLQNLDSRKTLGFTIGITNHEVLLDPAVWRRFEVQIEIPKPSFDDLVKILSKDIQPLEMDNNSINFLAWCLEGSSGADAEMMSRWIKKWHVMSTGNDKKNLLEGIRQFALMNTGRIAKNKKLSIMGSQDMFIKELQDFDRYDFKKKDVAAILDIDPSALSRRKHRETEKERVNG